MTLLSSIQASLHSISTTIQNSPSYGDAIKTLGNNLTTAISATYQTHIQPHIQPLITKVDLLWKQIQPYAQHCTKFIQSPVGVATGLFAVAITLAAVHHTRKSTSGKVLFLITAITVAAVGGAVLIGSSIMSPQSS